MSRVDRLCPLVSSVLDSPHVHRNHHYVSLSLNHLAALGHVAFFPFKSIKIFCDCVFAVLEILRQLICPDEILSDRLLRNGAGYSRGGSGESTASQLELGSKVAAVNGHRRGAVLVQFG